MVWKKITLSFLNITAMLTTYELSSDVSFCDDILISNINSQIFGDFTLLPNGICVMLTYDTYHLSKKTQRPIIISKKYHIYLLDLLIDNNF